MNGMRLSILLALALLIGCEKTEPPQETNAVKKLPLMLAIADRQEWLMITISNKSPRPVIINGLMRPAGPKPDLTFYLDGKPAVHNSSTHYFVMPEDLSDPEVSLGAQQSHGILIRKSNLLTLFEFPKGSCKEVQVFYKDALGVKGAFAGQLPSNKIEICL